jgi:hypothetical protein
MFRVNVCLQKLTDNIFISKFVSLIENFCLKPMRDVCIVIELTGHLCWSNDKGERRVLYAFF